MTQQKKMRSNILTLVATAHNEQFYNCPFVDSMLAQNDGNWRARVVNNGPDVEGLLNTLDVDDNRIMFCCSQIDTDNWGTTNRQQAIDECDTEYIIQTSVQDYWLPQAMDYILKTIERMSPDLIIWDSINHLVGPCKVLESKLEWAKIDWGNFAIKTDIAKKVGINHGDQYCADWLFIQDVLNSGLVDEKKIIKLPYILTIHN